MTVTMPPSKKVAKKNAKHVPENERYIRACSDIANALIQEYESQKDISKPRKDINLNKLRGNISKKHALPTQPPLTAIIAAVPEHYKKYILPKLIAKPIRTLLPSGDGLRVRTNSVCRNIVWYRSRGRHVQASPLPSYRIHRKHLRLLPRWP